MAVMAGPSVNDRLKVIEIISKVYEMRSGFVHRAVPVFDMSGLEVFFLEAWKTMFFLLNNYNKWKTKADFLRSIDAHKFTGPAFSTVEIPAI
jgi:hypothetical protein